MRISHKNRARLIAAAAGVSLFLNPGQATADDDAGSQSGTSSQSDSSGTPDSSAGDSSSTPGGSAPSDGSDSSGGSASPGGSDSGPGDASDGGSATSEGAGSDESATPSSDDSGGNAPDRDTSGNGVPAGTDTSGSSDADAAPTGTVTPTDTTPPTESYPDSGASQPATATGDTGNDGSQQGGQGAQDSGDGQPWTAPEDTSFTDYTGPDPTGTNSADTDATNEDLVGTNPEGIESAGAESARGTSDTDPSDTGAEPTDSTDSSTDSSQLLRFVAPSTPDDTETFGEPETFTAARFFDPITPATTTPPATLLAFLGIPPIGGPTATTTFATNPAPWTLLWWIQRTQSLLNNQTPNAAPTLDPTTNGYTISLNATDVDGDPLTTTIITQPTNGTATVNADGTISYTRSQNSTAADQFTVQISDNGPHLHGLASILALITGHNPHNRRVTVTIPETPSNQAPVIDPAQNPTISTPDPTTGTVVVTGLTTVVTDPDGDPLTFSSTDTDVVFDTQNPGTFTWTPTAQIRHDAAVPGAPQNHTVTITADDGNGGTVDLVVALPIDRQNEDPTVTAGTPSAPAIGTGAVTGTLTATDIDADTLTYTVIDATPTGTNTFTTGQGGTLIINPATGTYTYTPSSKQRWTAAYVNATTADTVETIAITVDDGHGGTVTETIAIPIDGIALAGLPDSQVLVAPDGSAYQTTYTYDPTTDSYTTHVTAITPTGTTTTTVTGRPTGGIQVAPDGTVYQTTYTYDPTTDSDTTHVTAITPTGTTTTTLDGFPDDLQIAPDGTAYLKTSTYDSATDSYTTYLTAITPTGTTTTTLDGFPADLQIAPDGTVYQTTYTDDPTTGDTTYYITTITPTGVVATTALTGYTVGGMQIAPDGTSYQTTYTYDPTTDSNTTYVTAITTTGDTTVTSLPGCYPSSGIQVAADGSVLQVLVSSDVTRIVVIKQADPATNI